MKLIRAMSQMPRPVAAAMSATVVPSTVTGYWLSVVLRVEESQVAAEAMEAEATTAVKAKSPVRAMIFC